MNIFASDRVKPENVKFPKNMVKLEWKVVTTYDEFCKVMENDKLVGTVVLDATEGESISGLKCSYALTEITCDKHNPLPTVMIIGPDQEMKSKIEEVIAKSKRWVDIARSRGTASA